MKMEITVRFMHFPHAHGGSEALDRGHIDIALLADVVSQVNRLVLDCYFAGACPEDVDLDDSTDFDPFYHYLVSALRDFARVAVIDASNTRFVVILPTDDVVDYLWALTQSPHDDTGVFHFVHIAFSRTVNKYEALRLARIALQKASEVIKYDSDARDGYSEIVVDAETGEVTTRPVY